MTTVQDTYNSWSVTNDSDQNLTRDLDAKVLRKVLGDRPVDISLEIGCGTGKNTGFLARSSSRVLAGTGQSGS